MQMLGRVSAYRLSFYKQCFSCLANVCLWFKYVAFTARICYMSCVVPALRAFLIKELKFPKK